MVESSPKKVENTVGKGEIARYKQFLLFPQCLLQTCKNQSLFGKGLTLSLLMTIQGFVDNINQDQTAQQVQSDLRSTPSTFVL